MWCLFNFSSNQSNIQDLAERVNKLQKEKDDLVLALHMTKKDVSQAK